MLGWLVVTPTLLGLLAGRWIDRHENTGIFWTAALLVVGVVVVLSPRARRPEQTAESVTASETRVIRAGRRWGRRPGRARTLPAVPSRAGTTTRAADPTGAPR